MTLVQLFDILFRRQRWVFVLVAVAVFLAAAAVTLSLTKEYRGTSTLVVGENRPLSAGADAVQLDDILARTYAASLTNPTLQRKIAARLDGVSAGELEQSISVEVVPGTRLIEISALDPDPEQARTTADVYARVFVADQKESLNRASSQSLDALDRRIGQLTSELSTLGPTPSPRDAARRAQLENELESRRQSYRTLQESTALQGSNVSVSSNAVVPAAPAKPRTKVYLALGLVFALLLGAVAALVRHAFDRRVRDEEEVSELLGGAAVLARIPMGRSEKDQRAMNEAFDFLRVNLRLSAADTPARVIAVTSALPGDGKSTVCFRLARAFAQQGADVVAADCDLRKPMLSTYFGVATGQGVTNVLVTGSSPLELLAESEVRGVRVLPSGPVPPNPSVLLGLPRFAQMIEELRSTVDFVVVDTPPVTAGVDTSAISQVVDGVVLVVDLNRSNRQALRAANEQLQKADARLLGIVLNRVTERMSSYGYGAGYGDSVRPGDRGAPPDGPSTPPAAVRAR